MNSDTSTQDAAEKSWLEKIGQLFSGEPRTRDDLEDVLTIAAENELIDDDARSIMEGAIAVSDMQARDIMIPRAQMVMIKAEASLEDILPQITRAAHSRYPVIGESPDDILGILLAKDLLPLLHSTDYSDFDLEPLLRPTVVVPESKRLNVLLREFREHRNHLALVIDVYGGVAGLVTIEDLLEEIVGEIQDEYDIEEPFVEFIGDNEYIFDARVDLDDLNRLMDVDLPTDDSDTLGGFIYTQLGKVPAVGDHVVFANLDFAVESVAGRRIRKVRVERREPTPVHDEEEGHGALFRRNGHGNGNGKGRP